MSYGISGSAPLADFAEPLKQTLKEFIEDNWDTYCTNPDTAVFGYEWTAGVKGNFAVHVLMISEIPTGNQDNSWHLVEYSQMLQVHVWALRQGNVEPIQLMNMMQGITRMLHVNKLSIVNNVRFFKPSWEPAHDPQNIPDTSYWRYIGTTEARFWRVSI